jgi:hypothetical protein
MKILIIFDIIETRWDILKTVISKKPKCEN